MAAAPDRLPGCAPPGGDAGSAKAQTSEDLQALTDLLKDKNVTVRRAAAYALINYPHSERAIPALVETLKDPDATVRAHVVERWS